MCHLVVLLNVILFGGNFLLVYELQDTVALGGEAVEDTASLNARFIFTRLSIGIDHLGHGAVLVSLLNASERHDECHAYDGKDRYSAHQPPQKRQGHTANEHHQENDSKQQGCR